MKEPPSRQQLSCFVGEERLKKERKKQKEGGKEKGRNRSLDY
jgi:hypothetical protein